MNIDALMRLTIFVLACFFGLFSVQENSVSHQETILMNEFATVTRQADAGYVADCVTPGPIVFVDVPIVNAETKARAFSGAQRLRVSYVKAHAQHGCGGYPDMTEYQVLLGAPTVAGRFEDDAVKLDPKHNEVLLENDRVRVVRIHFPPGESGPMVDKRARVIIVLTDSHATVTLPDGHSEVRDGKAGTVYYGKAGRQATNNIGPTPLENIVVELKGK
jgi:hypothetical protein